MVIVSFNFGITLFIFYQKALMLFGFIIEFLISNGKQTLQTNFIYHDSKICLSETLFLTIGGPQIYSFFSIHGCDFKN